MKVSDMIQKLDSIAENLTDLQIEGTTRIDWRCLTQKEVLLFDKITELTDKYGSQLPNDVLIENSALFDKGIEILARRAIDLFQTVAKALFMVPSQDDPLVNFVFTLRLFWFLQEMRRQVDQMHVEDELLKKYEDYGDFKKAWKEHEANLENKTALWSRESFERFVKPVFEKMSRKDSLAQEPENVSSLEADE